MSSFPPTRVVFSFEYRPCKELRMSYEEALEALKEGKYKEVLKWFEGLPPEKRDGNSCALAALAHFKREEYKVAKKLYAEAVTAGGTEAADWRRMKALADANATAEIDVE